MSTTELAKQTADRITAKDLFSQDSIKKKFKELLGENAQAFMTSVLQVVASNDLLKKAEPTSIYQCAAMAATLGLPLNNQLGFAWIVPYKKNYRDGVDEKGKDIWKSTVLAQFQIGYKGFIQLAQRTGEYRSINVTPVYKNQFVSWNELREELELNPVEGAGEIIGYCCFFRLLNGFEKTTFWKADKINSHAKKYSKSFDAKADQFTGVWGSEYDKMAMKTVLANTLKVWGILSIQMNRALKADQAVIKDSETEDVEYVDGTTTPAIDKEEERIRLMIQDAQTIEDLDNLYESVPESLTEAWLLKKQELSVKKLDEADQQPEIFDNVEISTTKKSGKK